LDNEGIKLKFDDIGSRVDFLIALCKSLQSENKTLLSKVTALETALEKKIEAEGRYAEQETMIENKIQGLLSKLEGFSDSQDSISNG